MQGREVYQQAPGLKSPWLVSKVMLDLERQRSNGSAQHPFDTRFYCSGCSESLPSRDHFNNIEFLRGRLFRRLEQCGECWWN